MLKERSLKTLPLDGGSVPFHFINTVYAWRGTNLHEYLNNYKEVTEWCRKVRLLPAKTLAGLKDYSEDHPQKMQEAFARIIEARSLLYQLFAGIAGEGANPEVIKSYNLLVRDAVAHYEWTKKRTGFLFIPIPDTTELLLPLYIVVKQSHDLLINEDLSRIKECPRCGWIFLDATKNNKRRWCNPSTCGSVDKSSKYYQKKKQQA